MPAPTKSPRPIQRAAKGRPYETETNTTNGGGKPRPTWVQARFSFRKTHRERKKAGATDGVTPAGVFSYGRGGEAELPTKFFAKLSFKKAGGQPALEDPEALLPPEEEALPEAELSAPSSSAALAAWMAAISL